VSYQRKEEVVMSKRALQRGLVGAATVGLLLGMSGVASADPIDCPGGQESTKSGDGWNCQNKGGHTSNAEDPKNPNKGKGDF
jgi:hypothetical protein